MQTFTVFEIFIKDYALTNLSHLLEVGFCNIDESLHLPVTIGNIQGKQIN